MSRPVYAGDAFREAYNKSVFMQSVGTLCLSHYNQQCNGSLVSHKIPNTKFHKNPSTDDMLYDYKWMEQFLLNYMSKWFAVNELSQVQRRQMHYISKLIISNDAFQIFYQCKEITEVTNIKFLGLGLDKHDTYRAHNTKRK